MRKQKYKGRCEKRMLSKSDQVCRFYSDLQSKYADKLDSDNDIEQIQCNVYLCNTEYLLFGVVCLYTVKCLSLSLFPIIKFPP